MNKKEVAEIKKTLTKDKTCIESIAGCYVNAEKQKTITFKTALGTLPEEEIHKYLKIFKSSLSGKIGDKLLNLTFSTDSEQSGTGHSKLMDIKGPNFDDNDALEKVFDLIIDNYNYPENYLILIANGIYDIPGNLDDASDYVYEHLLCAICPVKLSKEGLSCHADENVVRDRDRDWVVGMPIGGFLFPAFNNRNTDIHGMLYFSKDKNVDLISNAFEIKVPLFASEQKTILNDAVMTAFDNDCDYETMCTFYECMEDIAFEHKEDEEIYELTKKDIQIALEQAGADEAAISRFSEYYDNVVEDETIHPDNIIDNSTLTIETTNVKIKIAREIADTLEVQKINGKKCIVIEVGGDISLDGVKLK